MTQGTLPVRLHRGSGTPLHVQLASQVRELVTRGVLDAESRLPSTRALAADLAVARAVVEQAYDQLLAEGWLVARRGSGTFVADVGALPGVTPVERRRREAPTSGLVRLGTGTPWLDPRLQAGWRRAWRDVAAASPPRDYPDPGGLAELREEVAGYVSRTRGLACGADEVMITAGTSHGMELVLAALGPGGVAVEDPGYRAAVAAARHSGREVVDVRVDGQGLDVAALASHPGPVRGVYVTPAHQHPLGITMSAARRVALLAEARRREALVLEDDYDSEFRYDVAPLPALSALDRRRVVYLGTASKILLPGLRLGWLVAEADLVERIAEQRAARHDHPPWPAQHALLTLIREGHLDKAVRSARRVYTERGDRVVARLGGMGKLSAPVAGMYLTLLTEPEVAQAVADDGRRAGFDVPTLANLARSDTRAGLVIGFGGLDDAELDRALDVLEASLRRHS
jgi:GntR family transcriptional regulator/MocR family aminotransferase